ncbi:MAG: zinc ribbon domain-containing protein, partial [Elainellaceae cyanobacterium]
AVVGADIGPSTIAVVGEDEAFLEPFCDALTDSSKVIARLQRQMARQQRANNPGCFELSRCDLPKPGQKHGKRKLGRSIKGKKHVNQSKRYVKTRKRKSNIERKLSAHRKSLQGELVNKVLSIGKFINIEKLSYRAWQKMFGRSVGKRAPGMFVERLRQKAENAGGSVNEFPTQTTKLSQRCICGRINKKPLSQRVHACECGVISQRDLFSGYPARFVDADGCYQAEAARSGFLGVDSLLWSAWQQAGNPCRQSSIGSPQIVNVAAVPASEKNDREAWMNPDKRLDDVGLSESQSESGGFHEPPPF